MRALFEKIVLPGQSFIVRERNDPSFQFNWHFHPEYELTFIANSHGQRFVGDSIQRYGSGDLVLLGPNLPHTWASDPAKHKTRHRAIYAQFLESFAGSEFFSRPELVSIQALLTKASSGLRFKGKTQYSAGKAMQNLLGASGVRRMIGLLEVLDILARSKEIEVLSSRQYVPVLRRFDESRIDAACRFINESFTEPIAQPDAAKRAHLSVSAFSRFFKKTMGRTFSDYVNELRIGHACRLLIESDKSIAQIALASGFDNLSNFNRRFRSMKNTSPREFRRRFAESGHR